MAQEPSELDGEGTPEVGVDGPEAAYGRHGLRKDAWVSRHLRLEGGRGNQETSPHPGTSEVGRFLRKRHVCRHGPPQSRTARRSVPTSEVIGRYPGSPPKDLPHPGTSEVRRFLRKRHVRRHGPPRSRTARRSVPTSEVIGRYPGGQNPTVSDGVKTNETCRFKNHWR